MSGEEELNHEVDVEGEEGGEDDMDDAELAQMQQELEKAEQQKAELDKLNKMQGGAGKAETAAETAANAERDARSIFIGNVDFAASVEEVQQIFSDCGEINAITIPVDKFTGQAKGFAYLEFADKSSVLAALEKNSVLLRDRPIKVIHKRTNIPHWKLHPTRGRGGRGGFRGAPRGGFRGAPRGRGRGGYRGGYGGYGGHYHPYGY